MMTQSHIQWTIWRRIKGELCEVVFSAAPPRNLADAFLSLKLDEKELLGEDIGGDPTMLLAELVMATEQLGNAGVAEFQLPDATRVVFRLEYSSSNSCKIDVGGVDIQRHVEVPREKWHSIALTFAQQYFTWLTNGRKNVAFGDMAHRAMVLLGA